MDVQKALQNIKKLNETTLKLRKNLTGQQKDLKKIFKEQSKITKLADTELSKLDKLVMKEKQRVRANERIVRARKASSDIIKSSPFAFIERMNESMGQFLERSVDIKKAGGFQKVFSGHLQDTLGRLQKFGKVATEAIGAGLNVGLANAGGIMKLLIAKIGMVAAAFAPIAAVVGAVVALIFVLKKAWDFNIGGMQTSFFRVTGKLKDAWGRFNIALLKTLQKLAPLFKVVFGAIGAVVGGVFKGIGAIAKPIFEGIGEIVDIIAESFGKSADGGQTFIKVAQAIGSALAFVGSVVGVVIKLIFKVIATSIKWNLAIMKVLGVFKLFQGVFKVIGAGADFLVKSFEKLFGWVTKILEKMGLLKKDQGEAVKGIDTRLQARNITQGIGQGIASQNNVTNNNTFAPNLSVSTSAPINPSSGGAIADSMLNSIANQRSMF